MNIKTYLGLGSLVAALIVLAIMFLNSQVILITRAEHLDSNRGHLSNIFNEVKELDDIWSETIPDGDYIRIQFEKNLTSDNDITIYPRIIDGSPIIEVYEKEGNTIISVFDDIKSHEFNTVYLTGLKGKQDTFDLLVLDGDIQLDFIIDPIGLKVLIDNTSKPGFYIMKSNNEALVDKTYNINVTDCVQYSFSDDTPWAKITHEFNLKKGGQWFNKTTKAITWEGIEIVGNNTEKAYVRCMGNATKSGFVIKLNITYEWNISDNQFNPNATGGFLRITDRIRTDTTYQDSFFQFHIEEIKIDNTIDNDNVSWYTANGSFSTRELNSLINNSRDESKMGCRSGFGCGSDGTYYMFQDQDTKKIADGVIDPNGQTINDTFFIEGEVYPNAKATVRQHGGALAANNDYKVVMWWDDAPPKIIWTITVLETPAEGNAFNIEINGTVTGAVSGSMDLQAERQQGGCNAAVVLPTTCNLNIRSDGYSGATGTCTFGQVDNNTMNYSCGDGENIGFLVDAFACTGSNGTWELKTLTSEVVGGKTEDCINNQVINPPDNPPTWSENTSNSTQAGTDVLFSVKWEDDNDLSGYIFSFDNGTGSFVNDSFVDMVGVLNWSNVTKSINSTEGATIRWQVFANDSSNQFSATDIFQFDTTIITDTCTYVSGDWVVECSDNCVITSDFDIEGNDIIITGSGLFIVDGVDIFNYGKRFSESSCTIRYINEGSFKR